MNDNPSSDLGSAFDSDFDEQLPETVDRAAVKRMRVVARVLDEGMRLPGTNFRFGIDPVVGILPGAGDLVATAVSLYIVVESARLGVSYKTLIRMLGNIAVDTFGGSVPVLGTIFDAVWKANKMNVELALRDLAAASAEPPEDAVQIDVE